jgi:hypothetical protein
VVTQGPPWFEYCAAQWISVPEVNSVMVRHRVDVLEPSGFSYVQRSPSTAMRDWCGGYPPGTMV